MEGLTKSKPLLLPTFSPLAVHKKRITNLNNFGNKGNCMTLFFFGISTSRTVRGVVTLMKSFDMKVNLALSVVHP